VSKAAKEKGRELKKTAKRVTVEASCRSKAVKDSAPQEPSPVHDEKKLLKKEREVFKLYDIDLEVPRGQLCAIVGPVGAGKSSLVQGMIGGVNHRPKTAGFAYEPATEMRKTGGNVTFGGSVAYCAQTAWIQVRALLVLPPSTAYTNLVECYHPR